MSELIEHLREKADFAEELGYRDHAHTIREAADEFAAKDTEIAKLRAVLELVLPLAKGYAATNNVGNNGAYIAQAEAALEGGAR